MNRALVIFLLGVVLSAAAVGDSLSAKEEERERLLLKELRCLVCQNQSLASSNADLAKDMRAVVRRLVEDGRDNAAIIAVLTARYGDFVLYRPPFRLSTAFLWLSPFVVLLGALLAVFSWMQRRASLTTTLSTAQQQEARLLLQADKPNEKT